MRRTSYNPHETTINTANASRLHQLWSADLGGVIDAQPILASNVNVNGVTTNLVFVGTESGTFYAIDAESGRILWSKPLGSYTSSCTDLPVFGITGTATFDKATNRVYVADGLDHVHALNMATGQEVAGWPVTVATVSQEHVYSALTFNSANGLLYAETASYCDGAPYQGRIVAINTASAATVATFKPSGAANGGGLWSMGGATIDPATNDVYIATGNVFAKQAPYGNAIVRLSANLAVKAANSPNVPAGDNDFSGTPMLYQLPGCAMQVNAKNKDGILYTWATNAIVSGPTQNLAISGPDSFVGVAAFSPQTNLVYIGNPSTSGSYGVGMLAFKQQANCTLSLAWQVNLGPRSQGDTSEQVVTANGVAYFTDGYGKAVFALDARTGANLWNSGSLIGGPIFAAPTIDRHLYVASYDHKLYAFGI